MKRKIYFFALIFSISKSYSQSFLSSFPIKLEKKSVVTNFVDKDKEEAYVFVGNQKKNKNSPL